MTRSTTPDLALDYFHHAGMTYGDKIVIKSVFYQDRGWNHHPVLRKRVSVSELRRLRGVGASHVQLAFEGREADFSISELLSTKVGA